MSYITPHCQDEIPGWDQGVARAAALGSPLRAIKFFQVEPWQIVRQISPRTRYIYRQHYDNHNQGALLAQAGQSPAQADQAADIFISTFSDSLNLRIGPGPHPAPVYAESLNETYATGDPVGLHRAIQFDLAFVRRLPLHCPGIRPLVFTAAIGNPGHPDAAALLPLAAATARAGGAMGYHAYHTVYNGHSFVASPQIQRDLHLRWALSFDQYFVSRGEYVDWYLGEGGATKGDPSGYNPDVLAGWKHGQVWGGNLQAYLADLQRLDQALASTLAARQGRLIGLAVFTSKINPEQWQYFNMTGGDYQALCTYIGSHPTPSPGPLPPPPPPPDPSPDPGLATALVARAEQLQCISLNSTAALQRAILAAGRQPVGNEGRLTHEGQQYALQPAEALGGPGRWIYYCLVPQWNNIKIIQA